MNPDYEDDDYPCLACGHYPTRYEDCSVIGCEDGWISLYDEDPVYYDLEYVEMCQECSGTGIVKWCPECGRDPREAVSSTTLDQTSILVYHSLSRGCDADKRYPPLN